MLDKQKHRVFLINRDIEFWPTDNLLYSRRTKTELKIFSTASRCLVCLLENSGRIVSQNDLFVAGWGSDVEGVKPNALYQNIMEVRRKMKILGMTTPFLETISRKGWQITLDTTIDIIEKDPDKYAERSVVSGNYTHYHKMKASLHFGHRKTLSIRIFFVLAFIFLFTFFVINYYSDYSDSLFHPLLTYQEIETIDKCIIFTPPGLYPGYLSMFERHYDRTYCKDKRAVYMSFSPPYISFISCSVNGRRLTGCVTRIHQMDVTD